MLSAIKLCAVAATALLACFSDRASAQTALCAAPAQSCAATIEPECLTRLGLGPISDAGAEWAAAAATEGEASASSSRCQAQLASYRTCLTDIVERCGAGYVGVLARPTATAGSCEIPARSCAAAIEPQCLSRLGVGFNPYIASAGSLGAEAVDAASALSGRCRAQLETYRNCLVDVVARCGDADGPRRCSESRELELWSAVKETNNPMLLRHFLTTCPQGDFAPIAEAMLSQRAAAAPGLAAPDLAATETGRGEAEAAAAWAAIESTRDARQVQIFIATFGQSAQAALARLRLAQLRTEFREAQRHLNRLGIGVGAADGVWGPRSQAGLEEFFWRRREDPPSELTLSALETLRAADPPPAAETAAALRNDALGAEGRTQDVAALPTSPPPIAGFDALAVAPQPSERSSWIPVSAEGTHVQPGLAPLPDEQLTPRARRRLSTETLSAAAVGRSLSGDFLLTVHCEENEGSVSNLRQYKLSFSSGSASYAADSLPVSGSEFTVEIERDGDVTIRGVHKTARRTRPISLSTAWINPEPYTARGRWAQSANCEATFSRARS